MTVRKVVIGLWLGLALLTAGGCAAAAPDASKAISRGIINSGDIVPAEQLRVAEYLKHDEHGYNKGIVHSGFLRVAWVGLNQCFPRNRRTSN